MYIKTNPEELVEQFCSMPEQLQPEGKVNQRKFTSISLRSSVKN